MRMAVCSCLNLQSFNYSAVRSLLRSFNSPGFLQPVTLKATRLYRFRVGNAENVFFCYKRILESTRRLSYSAGRCRKNSIERFEHQTIAMLTSVGLKARVS